MSEEPVPETVPDDVETVRILGSIGIIVGGLLCVAALVLEEGDPPWQVLTVFLFVTVVGLGLRLEAALRRHS
jgi:hypothetical protein